MAKTGAAPVNRGVTSVAFHLLIMGLGIAFPARAFAQATPAPIEAAPPPRPPVVAESGATRMVGGHIVVHTGIGF